MLSRETLSKLRAMIKQAEIDSETNTDEQALEVQGLYPDWSVLPEGCSLKEGERLNYQGLLYKVLQGHTKQSDWSPKDAPSLFTKIIIPNKNDIPEWEQPDSTNAYRKDDKVTHNGSTWVSLVDNNVWEPGALGTETLWEEIDQPL